MDSFKVKYILVAIWLVGLLFCLGILLPAKQALPDLFGKALDQIFDTFSPQLATMLAFIFSDQFMQEKKRKINTFVGALAIIISVAYVSTFCYYMFSFYSDKMIIEDVIDSFSSIRPKASFLVTAAIAYFFASRKEADRA